MRYFIYLQYDGTNYHGWQTQPDAVSVQETIEQKLSMLMRRELFIVGAGRTDTGVHARLMVAHFDTDAEVDCQQLAFKLNNTLPPDISILRIVRVRDDAHARFSPVARTYKYYITRRKAIFNRTFMTRVFEPLDVEMMNHAAAKLFCYRDFTSFAKLHSDTKTNICNVMEAYWQQPEPDTYVFTIKADRFLRNMVRAVVGTLVLVGRHKLTVKEFAEVIERKDRCTAGDSMAAQGLFLEDIEYPNDIFIDQEDAFRP
ncbi:MAG: tRNA pseudouridine(38-40) synthase TruA [Bacteroidales bacterium]|nr:tRNA pseudouridine(38-40) synthase TruA [Candidatus Liminaster caballi]